jgi:hypothetical protein
MGIPTAIHEQNAFPGVTNKALSEKANDVDYYADAYLKVLGATLDAEGAKHIRDNRIINFEGDDAAKIVCEFMAKPEGDTTQENLLNRLERLIFQISMVANISDENFGASSGIALKYKLQAMSNLENTFKIKTNKSYKERSPFMSLLIKEIKCVFRSPGNVFEYFLFTLLMPVIVLAYDKLLLTISVNTAGQNMIAGSHLMIVAILAMLSNIISASSISRDGGNFYISKIVPVNYYTQIGAKLVFNAVFTVGAILVTMCISFIYQNALQVILGSIAVMFASFFLGNTLTTVRLFWFSATLAPGSRCSVLIDFG